MKRILIILGKTVLITFTCILFLFLAARYGWRLFGFSACSNTVYCSDITVENGVVELYGTTVDSFSSYVGCISKIEDGNLYIGTKHNAFLGFFRRIGSFHIVLKPKEDFERIYLVGSNGIKEPPIWTKSGSIQ